MSFVSGFLRDDSLHFDESGFTLVLGLPWMRALPWSSVQRLSIEVDDAEVPESAIRWLLDGQFVTREELSEHWHEYWAMHHRVRVAISRTSPLPLGSSVNVTATAELRIPYLSVGPGKAMVVESSATRTLTVSAA